MKTLLACAFGASLLGTAVVCATAGERATPAVATLHVGPASITLPTSVLASAPATADLKPSLGAEDAPRHPVRVVLASPYVPR